MIVFQLNKHVINNSISHLFCCCCVDEEYTSNCHIFTIQQQQQRQEKRIDSNNCKFLVDAAQIFAILILKSPTTNTQNK